MEENDERMDSVPIETIVDQRGIGSDSGDRESHINSSRTTEKEDMCWQ